MTKITTITSCWGRPDALETWLEAMRHASFSEVEHILFIIGEKAPAIPNPPPRLQVIEYPKPTRFSIGHAHNMGARLARTEWIMKLDVDTIPNANLFRNLMPVIDEAERREWFNIGMLYFKKQFNEYLLRADKMPIGRTQHDMIARNMPFYSTGSYSYPAASNFLCRTQEYLDLGGCDDRFDGYGWEDYQQMYMLERWQRHADPLPGPLHEHNVTQRCRNEISRPKAMEMFRRDPSLFLYHRWHPTVAKPGPMIAANRRVLLENILHLRNNRT